MPLEARIQPDFTRHESLDVRNVGIVAAAPPRSGQPLIDASPQHIVRAPARIIRAPFAQITDLSFEASTLISKLVINRERGALHRIRKGAAEITRFYLKDSI